MNTGYFPSGLPLYPELNEDLRGLRGVVARAPDPDERLDRVKALSDLLAPNELLSCDLACCRQLSSN